MRKILSGQITSTRKIWRKKKDVAVITPYDIYHIITTANHKSNGTSFVCLKDFHSGRGKSRSEFLIFDFDQVEIPSTKDKLLSLKEYETVLLFRKASHNGVTWIIKNTSGMKHAQFFRKVSNHLRQTYNLDADPCGQYLERCCFLPYDPEAYINPKYIPSSGRTGGNTI